jgi:kynureninase
MVTTGPTRADLAALDDADPLVGLRDLFELPPGVIYLDGNSLGPLPRSVAARLQRAVAEEWGRGLIGSWNRAGWIDLPHSLGDRIAPLVGAAPGEVVVADSTSVNLFKVLAAAAAIQRQDAPARRVVLSERENFPTDLYVASSVARERGLELRLVDTEQLDAALDEQTALLLLTHVNYRTGRMHDLPALTRAARAAGALAVWDLAHSAGAVPVDLNGAGADFAVGCGYKYLNGGPGAPAFLWSHRRHRERAAQPLAGWMGHAAPFAFAPDYRPAAGVGRFLCGTPPVLSMLALACGVDTVRAADPLGGVPALRAKSLALTRTFIELVECRCGGTGLECVSPREDARRGSQVCLARAEGGYAIVQALIARGVIGDFRAGGAGAPDILRFGFAPLYVRFVDVWDAVEHLRQVLAVDEWRDERFQRRATVT